MFRVLGLLVLLYVSADLGNASIPGIFSFASDQLFVDGVVRIKAAVPVAEPADDLADPLLLPWSADAPPVARLAASAARPHLASSRHRPQHRVGMTAARDRADGEPPV
jgi:hypothetical protein